MASEPAQTHLLWAIILSLALPVRFGHNTTSVVHAVVLPSTFSTAIHFDMNRSAPCSAVLRHSPSSWAAVVHWSALIPKALRSSRKHPINSFSWSPTQPAPPISSPNITPFGSLVSSMRAINLADKIRLLRIVASMLSLPVFRSVSRHEIGWSLRLFFRQPMQRVRKLWWTWCSVKQWHARGLHVTQPYSIVSSTSALSIRILSSRGGGRSLSYSSRVHFRKLHHALRMCRLTLWLTFPPRYTNSFVWLYTWPAASTLNMAMNFGITFMRNHMISALASDTLRPNAAHTTTIISIIFLSCSGDCEMTEIIFCGTPKRASTLQRRVRSTESYALVRSIKHVLHRTDFVSSAPIPVADESRT